MDTNCVVLRQQGVLILERGGREEHRGREGEGGGGGDRGGKVCISVAISTETTTPYLSSRVHQFSEELLPSVHHHLLKRYSNKNAMIPQFNPNPQTRGIFLHVTAEQIQLDQITSKKAPPGTVRGSVSHCLVANLKDLEAKTSFSF